MPTQYTAALAELDEYNLLVMGTKGLVFIGDAILVYRRDGKTNQFPFMLDLPGGGQEAAETPFQTFSREVHEEFGLAIRHADMVYARKYESRLENGKFAYFVVAKLPKEAEKSIRFGDEGIGFLLMSLDEYMGHKDTWSVLQERARDYLHSRQG